MQQSVIYVAVALALLVWGALTGYAGRKLGIALALIPVLGWLGVLAWFSLSGNLDSPAGDVLPAYLLVGLLAFLVGSNLMSWFSTSGGRSRKE